MAGNADMHKTSGVNPRRNLPYNPYAMAAAGLAFVGGLWYIYNRNKPADPDDTRHLK